MASKVVTEQRVETSTGVVNGHMHFPRHAGGKLAEQPHPLRSLGASHAVRIGCLFGLMFALILWRIYWTPTPLPISSAPTLFSEERALRHVNMLAGEIGERQVSTPALDLSAHFLLQTGQHLVQQAEGRNDLLVQVRQEQVSGGVLMALLGLDLANIYQNLTNIVLTITPKAHQTVPAVLVNGHFDSAIGSPGASDCASPVGVMLEAARVFIASPDIKLAGPIIFLFNGAEETLSQAAHGFMAHDRQSSQVGAFINLESTGPGGPDILFQASGGWTTEVYAKAAPHARGQVFGQDLMDAQIIPADTDYRMFSYKYYGSLPGVDIAFLLDSSAYHTHNDSPDRIRPGTVQAMGDNMVAVIPAFAQYLSEAAANNLPPASPATSDSVYFDILGLWMISYRASTASMLCCLATPAAVGGLRAFISGQQLVWFSNHLAGAFIYMPAALMGGLLPFHLAHRRGVSIATQVAGSCLFNAILAVILTVVGGKVAYSHFSWAAAAYISLWIVPKVDSPTGLSAALACAVVPATSVLTGILLLATHLMEKMSMTGAPPGPLIWGPDAIMGALFGAGTFVYAGYVMPWLAHCLKRPFKRTMRALLFISVISAVAASLTLDTYTPQTPKRLFLQHMIRVAANGEQESLYAAASSDATPVDVVLKGMNLTSAQQDGREWLAMYPMHDMIRGKVFEAPPADKELFPTPPTVHLLSRDSSGGTDRLHLELRLPRPGVGVVNVTGPLHAWSFTDQLPRPVSKRGVAQHVARYGGNVGTETWPFWLDVQCEETVTVSIAASFLTKTAAIESFTQQMPDWTAHSATTTFQSSWTF
ncbi:hypothetical protein WJX79_001663 [Trebouxia sp. C0005]